MYAIVLRSTLHDFDTSTKDLRERIVPSAKGSPGFVSGQWVRLGEHTGTSMLTFETEEAARAVLENIEANPPAAVTIDSAEIGEVVASV